MEEQFRGYSEQDAQYIGRRTARYRNLALKITGAREKDMLPLREEDIEAISKVLEGALTPKQRTIIRMKFLSPEKTENSVMQRMVGGISRTALYNNVNRAFNCLRKPENILVFKKLFRSVLEEMIDSLKKEVFNQKEELETRERLLADCAAIIQQIQRHSYKPRMVRQLIKEWQNLMANPSAHSPSVYAKKISDFGLGIRIENCLAKAEIRTVGDLLKPKNDLLRIKGFGLRYLMEVEEKILFPLNLKLPAG